MRILPSRSRIVALISPTFSRSSIPTSLRPSRISRRTSRTQVGQRESVCRGQPSGGLVLRALEQLRTFVAYPRLRIVVAAALSGLSGGIEGVAHLATEDVGILRSIPNMTILNPADATAARQLVAAAARRP